MSAARRALALGVALLAALAQGACAPPPIRVVLIGDSITAGVVSEPRGPSYAELLARQLGSGFEIVNVACGGATTLDWLPDAPAAVCRGTGGRLHFYAERARPALPADLATILLGTNDMRGGFGRGTVEPDAYRDALRALAGALHADGAREVLLLTPPYAVRGVVWVAQYRARVQALCQELSFVHCGPDLVALLRADDFAPGDVHPNASGHAKIAEALAAALRERAPH